MIDEETDVPLHPAERVRQAVALGMKVTLIASSAAEVAALVEEIDAIKAGKTVRVELSNTARIEAIAKAREKREYDRLRKYNMLRKAQR